MVEQSLLCGLLINYLAIFSAAGRYKPIRTLISAMTAALITLAFAIHNVNAVISSITAALIASAIVSESIFTFKTLRIAMYLISVSALINAVAVVSEYLIPLTASIACLIMREGMKIKAYRWNVNTCITHMGYSVKFISFIDTGNRLMEPISGLPILIAEEALISGAFARDGFTSARSIHFSGVGGSGRLECFMPDRLIIENKVIRDIWVAVYPGKLPGNTRAILPPCVIDNISKK